MNAQHTPPSTWPLRGAALLFGVLALSFYALSLVPAMAAAVLIGAGCEIAFWISLLRSPKSPSRDAGVEL
jgi:hypothetical protein